MPAKGTLMWRGMPKMLSPACDTGKVRKRDGDVGHEECKHRDGREAHAKALANERGESLTGNRAHAHG